MKKNIWRCWVCCFWSLDRNVIPQNVTVRRPLYSCTDCTAEADFSRELTNVTELLQHTLIPKSQMWGNNKILSEGNTRLRSTRSQLKYENKFYISNVLTNGFVFESRNRNFFSASCFLSTLSSTETDSVDMFLAYYEAAEKTAPDRLDVPSHIKQIFCQLRYLSNNTVAHVPTHSRTCRPRPHNLLDSLRDNSRLIITRMIHVLSIWMVIVWQGLRGLKKYKTPR